MALTRGDIRENHVVEFEEGRRMAWRPAEVGSRRPGTCGAGNSSRPAPSRTRVTCTYDWTQLTDPRRACGRARATTAGPAPGLARPARGPG